MDIKNTEVIKGTVADITYQNNETGFTVLELEDENSILTVVGIMPDVCVGEVLEIAGSFDHYSIYGRQFKVFSYMRIFPSDSAAILRYLSAGAIKGIGPATAKRIVSEFGNETFEVLLNHPELVCKIKGITRQRAEEISQEISRRNSMRDILRFFSVHGFKTEETLNIFKKFGENSITAVSENPYVICNQGIDISFQKAEAVAEQLGFDKYFAGRIEAGILYILSHNLLNGHTCLPLSKLLKTSSDFLSVTEKDVYDIVLMLDREGIVVCYYAIDREYVFLREYYDAEQYISARLCMADDMIVPFNIEEKEINEIENKSKIKFDDLQKKAIYNIAKSGVYILSGGPGTGKTTVINAMIEIFNRRGMKIALAAPTGRAAQRITEVTGVEAKTIHRLLEVEKLDEGQHRFTKNEREPLDCDVIIIDEMSMVDSQLFASALKALKMDCRIILVGDHNQLPSVGAGNVLQDILYSDAYNSSILKTVFRQALQSNIVVTAHGIVSGVNLDINNNGKDFFAVNIENPANASKYILDLCINRLPNSRKTDLFSGIQILCPSKMMQLGVDALNSKLQELINPYQKGKKEIKFQGYIIRENDKVMQIKNNYDIIWKKENGEFGTGIFNGDIGYVKKIDVLNRTISVQYDDKIAEYMAEDIFQLELAYAITIHKSQGSEFDYVIIPVVDIPTKLMYRNLLYTGVTRAKKMLIIVGNLELVNKMIENDRKTLRYTGLYHFIKEINDVIA